MVVPSNKPMYLDQRCLDWITLCKLTELRGCGRESFHYSAVVKTLYAKLLECAGLDVIALGPGDGKAKFSWSSRFTVVRPAPTSVLSAGRGSATPSREHSSMLSIRSATTQHLRVRHPGQLPPPASLHPAPLHRHAFSPPTHLRDAQQYHRKHRARPQFFQSTFSGGSPGDLLLFVSTMRSRHPVIPKKSGARSPPLNRFPTGISAGWEVRSSATVETPNVSISHFASIPIVRSQEVTDSVHLQRYTCPASSPKSSACTKSVATTRSLVRCLRGFGWESIGVSPFTALNPAHAESWFSANTPDSGTDGWLRCSHLVTVMPILPDVPELHAAAGSPERKTPAETVSWVAMHTGTMRSEPLVFPPPRHRDLVPIGVVQ